MKTLFPLAATALLLSSCATLSQLAFELPEVSVEGIEVGSLSLSGGAFTVELDVYNPNAYDLHTARVDLSVALEDTHFGDVALERATTLPSSDHATVRVPVEFTWAGVGIGARALLTRGEVNYGVDTRMVLDTPIGARALDVHRDGVIPLSQLVR